MKNTNIEVEGGELLIMSKEGHYAVIPAKHRREVQDMIKDGCTDCINNYIQGLPKDSDYAEDGTVIPKDNPITNRLNKLAGNVELNKSLPINQDNTNINFDKNAFEAVKTKASTILDAAKSIVNPNNWGVKDYTDKGVFDLAYQAARSNDESEFMWNNKRYNTNYKGDVAEQYKVYGNTNEFLQNESDDKTKDYIKTFANTLPNVDIDKNRGETLNRMIDLQEIAKNPSINDSWTKTLLNRNRGRYIPFTNSIYLPKNDYSTYVAELAHAYRMKNDLDIGKDTPILGAIKVNIGIGSNEWWYNSPKYEEFKTHEITQPAMNSYIEGHKPKEYVEMTTNLGNSGKMDEKNSTNGIDPLKFKTEYQNSRNNRLWKEFGYDFNNIDVTSMQSIPSTSTNEELLKITNMFENSSTEDKNLKKNKLIFIKPDASGAQKIFDTSKGKFTLYMKNNELFPIDTYSESTTIKK